MCDVNRIYQLYLETRSKRKVAEIMGISRNTVSKYLNRIENCKNGLTNEILPEDEKVARPNTVCKGEIRDRILSMLLENQEKPKNKDLNAKQIFSILVGEGEKISYSTVLREVSKWKESNSFKDVCIAQEYDSGFRSECDWGTVVLKIPEEPAKYKQFSTVLNYSLYRFGRIYPNESQENLFHALIEFFHEIGGVPENIFFDNMKTVVTNPKEKVFNERFLRFSAHYGFKTNACNPHSPQEKGTVEKTVSVIRTSAFGLKDTFSSLEEANEHLKNTLSRINSCKVGNREMIPIDALKIEQKSFIPLPSMDFQPYDLKYRKVDRYSTVTFERNNYSVPESCKAERLSLKIYCFKIEIFEGDELIAEHPRIFDKNKYSLNVEHYLSTLRNKPGSLRSSRLLKVMDQNLKDLYSENYVDKPEKFIMILLLIREYSHEEVIAAIKGLRNDGIIPDYELIKLNLNFKNSPEFEDFDYKYDIEVPNPDLREYDR
ncbi:LOW QUALITY PROTEIN: hypothetical protein Metlim_2655 [Methanoplanus limicola DSM 2279]|uniref:Integrase catalytic domain-containing protein n=2 Tax=Methanoplanus limicola TaxID=2315 RepID=H1Z4E6_9EURY|nr:LOW QUALITY PROTEIN: hypothetical protein Metlim_2655 [Methanoplanus limicola DSM 2279]